ncbi:Peptidase family M23 [Thermoleophilum album]|uniref:Peptidase family M23 n=1 Tax=Thermoleophilum album TaxID=29539 RepID=A0A1H6FMX5_THEAL|nr:Peptidase family M23 [Thermoleophilum album]
MRSRRIVLPLAVTLLAATPSASVASGGAAYVPQAGKLSTRSGGSAPPAARSSTDAASGAAPRYRDRAAAQRTSRERPVRGRSRRPRGRLRPRLRPARVVAFNISQQRLYLGGPALRVSLRVAGRGGPWRVELQASPAIAGARTAAARSSIELGVARANRDLAATVTPEALSPTGGEVILRPRLATARGARVPLANLPAVAVRVLANAFPLRGPWRLPGPDGRFGAPRADHRHEGQDLVAAEGTPVVAPAAGQVVRVAYQPGGAGHYVVLRDPRMRRDYVFMHLRERSITVVEGQTVATGARIAEVGSTGRSSGPHLHFEVWVGRWRDGGRPIDPLPLLETWARNEGLGPDAGR